MALDTVYQKCPEKPNPFYRIALGLLLALLAACSAASDNLATSADAKTVCDPDVENAYEIAVVVGDGAEIGASKACSALFDSACVARYFSKGAKTALVVLETDGSTKAGNAYRSFRQELLSWAQAYPGSPHHVSHLAGMRSSLAKTLIVVEAAKVYLDFFAHLTPNDAARRGLAEKFVFTFWSTNVVMSVDKWFTEIGSDLRDRFFQIVDDPKARGLKRIEWTPRCFGASTGLSAEEQYVFNAELIGTPMESIIFSQLMCRSALPAHEYFDHTKCVLTNFFETDMCPSAYGTVVNPGLPPPAEYGVSLSRPQLLENLQKQLSGLPEATPLLKSIQGLRLYQGNPNMQLGMAWPVNSSQLTEKRYQIVPIPRLGYMVLYDLDPEQWGPAWVSWTLRSDHMSGIL